MPRWPRAMPPARRDLYARAARRGQHQRPGAGRAGALLCRDRRARAGASRRWPWCRKPSATTPPSPPRRPRSNSPSRPRRSARSPSWSRKSPPIRSTIRRGSISRWRSTARASRLEALDQLIEHRQARPQMERRRRPQAAGAVLRGLGSDRRSHDRGPQAAVVDPVRVDACVLARGESVEQRRSRAEYDMPMNADLQGARRPSRA